MTALYIIFLIVYYFLEAIHDYYIWEDLATKNDSVNPARKLWHMLSMTQAGVLLVFMVLCLIFGFHPSLTLAQLILIFILVRWVFLDNVYNVIRGGWSNIFYVERENSIGGFMHSVNKFTGVPAEMVALIFKAIILIAIFFV